MLIKRKRNHIDFYYQFTIGSTPSFEGRERLYGRHRLEMARQGLPPKNHANAAAARVFRQLCRAPRNDTGRYVRVAK